MDKKFANAKAFSFENTIINEKFKTLKIESILLATFNIFWFFNYAKNVKTVLHFIVI